MSSFAAASSHHLTATTAISVLALMTLQPSPHVLVIAQREHPPSSCGAELKTYKYFTARKKWRDAQVECRNSAYRGQQGALATIRSAEEQTLIEQLGFVRDPYIGGYGGNSGEWKWIGDDALFWSNSGQPLDVTYNNFDTTNAEPHGDFDHLFIWRTIGHEFMWGDRQPCRNADNDAEYHQLHLQASAECQSNYRQCSDGCDQAENGCLSAVFPGDDDSFCYQPYCREYCDDNVNDCEDAAYDAYAFCEDQLHHEFICEYCMEEAGYQGWRTVEGSSVSGYCDGQSRVLIQSYSIHADRAGCHYTHIPRLSLDDTSCGYMLDSDLRTLASYATAITIEDVGYGEYRTEEPALLDALKNGENWHRPEMTVGAWEKLTSHPFDMCIDTSACTSAQSNTNWPQMVDSCSNSKCLRWTITSNFKHTFASAHHKHDHGTYFQASRTWLTVPGLCDPTPPTIEPTVEPSLEPTIEPTVEPSLEPTAAPTIEPTVEPSLEPTAAPTIEPTVEPSLEPTAAPTIEPTVEPSLEPTATPTIEPARSGPVYSVYSNSGSSSLSDSRNIDTNTDSSSAASSSTGSTNSASSATTDSTNAIKSSSSSWTDETGGEEYDGLDSGSGSSITTLMIVVIVSVILLSSGLVALALWFWNRNRHQQKAYERSRLDNLRRKQQGLLEAPEKARDDDDDINNDNPASRKIAESVGSAVAHDFSESAFDSIYNKYVGGGGGRPRSDSLLGLL